VVLGHQRLMGEHEGVLGMAGVLVKTAVDPILLIADRVTIVVTIEGREDPAGRHPVVDDEETGAVAMIPIVKRVAHTGQVGADRRRTAEVRSAEGVAEAAGLRKIRLERRDGIVVSGRAIGLVIAAHGEKADARVDKGLGSGRPNGNVGVVAVLG